MSGHVVVAVLGDLGRSPRMQYHAYSLATEFSEEEMKRVTLIGYEGEECSRLVTSNNRIFEQRLKLQCEFTWLKKISGIVFSLVKGVYLLMVLINMLYQMPSYQMIIIQNPPSLPLVIAAIIVNCLGKNAKICIDWHNLGFSMYDPQYLKDSPRYSASFSIKCLTHISKLLEHHIVANSMFTTHHLCVSKAMKEWLITNFGISRDQIAVFYDKPPKHFVAGQLLGPRSGYMSSRKDKQYEEKYAREIRNRHELLMKLGMSPAQLWSDEKKPLSASASGATPRHITNTEKATLQTKAVYDNKGAVTKVELLPLLSGKVSSDWLNERTILVLSSTSWTEDEDFGLLVNAMTLLDKQLVTEEKEEANNGAYKKRRIVVVVTGKGPLKEHYEHIFKGLNDCNSSHHLKYVRFTTIWLESIDYPAFIRCADVGICLHTSTSGLDLPMKVLDMLGSGVPCLAISYPTLPELIKHNVNGFIFKNDAELKSMMYELFYTSGGTSLEKLHQGVLQEATNDKEISFIPTIGNWEENWREVVKPIVYSKFLVKHRKLQ